MVGYAGNDLDKEYGAVLITPQFISVNSESANTVTLGSMIPVGAIGSDLSFNIEIQKLNNWGGSVDGVSYSWDGTKWIDTYTNKDASNETVNSGEGLWIYSMMGEPVTFQSSGQVSETDIIQELDKDYGAVAVANGFPVAVKINDIVLSTAEGVDLGFNIEIQKLNNWGGSVDGVSYSWDGTKWIDTYTNLPLSDDVVVNPGEGLWVYNMTGEAVNLRVPAPEF